MPKKDKTNVNATTKLKTVIGLFIFLIFCSSAFGIEIENSSTVQSVTAKITIEGTGTIAGNLQGKEAEIEVLSFNKGYGQKVLTLSEILEINGKTINGIGKKDELGNRYALFKIGETGNFSYKIEALIETDAMPPVIEDFDLSHEITEFEEFLQPSENIESNHESIRTFAFNTFDNSSWLETLVEITQWTYDNIEYDLSYFPETYSAVSTLKERKGVCDEFAVLAASMLRAKGIPVKVATGLSFNPKEGQKWNNHAWLQAFNPNSGWISLDPTFGEAGTVDGTHIVRGFFKDPIESSVSKAIVIQTASITINENPAVVETTAFKPFSGIFSIETENETMPANKWHKIEINAKNMVNGNVIGWFSIGLPVDFVALEKKKILLFEEGEEKEITWDIRVDKELEENEYLTGAYKIVSLGGETQKELKILPGTKFQEEAEIIIGNIIPIVENNSLTIDIELENRGAEKGLVEITLEEISKSIEINGFETTEVAIKIPEAENKTYSLTVKGPGLEFETEIELYEGKPLPVEQPLATTNNQVTEPLSQTKLDFSGLLTIETAIIAGIIIGIAIIAFLLKELLSK